MAHNFYVGNLGFHKVVNDDHPYERATAPFRKEQFDNSATVGDQSLAGWWTRGQLSFHGGEGFEYYEVLDGAEVLNTYYRSEHIDTLSEPGKARLFRDLDLPFVSHTASVRYVAAGFGGTVFLDTAGPTWARGGDIYRLSGYPTSASPPTPTKVTLNGTGPWGQRVTSGPGYREFYAAVVDDTSWTIQKIPDSGSTITLYNGGTGNWDGLWFAKDRLWALTIAGELYALSVSPGTTPSALGTPVLTFKDARNESLARPALAEAPTGLYISRGDSRIYFIGINADGSVPTLSAPVVVAELPRGEEVYDMRYYLGHLVLVTSAGTRVAAEDRGSIVFGPLVLKWTDSPREAHGIAALDSSVYVCGVTPSHASGGVYELDLSKPSQENSLVFAHRNVYSWADPNTGFAEPMGAFDYGDALAFFLAGKIKTITGVYSLANTGELRTGYHRLGTLDEKHFQSVVVRVGQTVPHYQRRDPDPFGGSISVYRLDDLDEDGVLLGSVMPGDGVVTLPLGLTAPQEKVALRFVFSTYGPESVQGPELLGYQIKALPSPQRQRLIRVPLMMFDIERGPTGRAVGKEKDAWTRYQALEALEESDALVTFEDKDTGETGTAYIESVELVQRNGSKGVSRANGFGGIVSLTLRKVA